MSTISMIVAMAHGNVIGRDGSMPWHLPADLAWFKQHTLNKPIIMGRKTWDSIGRPLPHRLNIVISRKAGLHLTGATVVSSPDEAIEIAGNAPEIMIIGGAQLYNHFLPVTSRLYLTKIDVNVGGDTCFPAYNASDWRVRETHSHPADTKNPHPYQFLILER